MDGGIEHAGEHGTVAMGHGSKNRGHREMAGVHAISAVPRRRSEERSEVAVAMAGDAKLVGARKTDPRNRETRKQRHKEKEGSKGVLTAEKIDVDGGLGTADHAEGGRQTTVLLRCGGCGLLVRRQTRNGEGR